MAINEFFFIFICHVIYFIKNIVVIPIDSYLSNQVHSLSNKLYIKYTFCGFVCHY